MNNIKNIRSSPETRKQTRDAAIASVRAEGFTQSVSTLERLELYVSGKMSATKLRNDTLAEARNKSTTSR